MDEAEAVGATLLVSLSAGGPLLASFPLATAALRVLAPPPNTYWLLMLVGNTTANRAPVSAWAPLVVSTACISVPGAPTLGSTVTGATVRLNWNGGAGCGWDNFRLEVGTTPGGVELGTIPVTGLTTTIGGVPSGTYYLRMKAVNVYGVGPASRELPVSVPAASCNGPRNATSGLNAVVQGNFVTIAWNPPPGPVATTYYQVLLKDRFSPNQNDPVITTSFIVPASVTSLSAVVPSGGYRIQVLAGNACRTSLPLGIDLFFNVP